MELFKLLGRVAIDTNEANNAIDTTTDKAQNSETVISGAFSKIGGAAVAGAKVIGTAAVALGGAWVAAIEGTREYRVSMGMLETAFATAGHSAGSAKQTYSDLNAVLGDTEQATEASQMLAKLTDDEKELDNWTHILTGVYSTFGQALPVEGLAEAALHSSSLGTVQGSLADALEWSGITVESFNDKLAKCGSEQERQQLITKTLNELYGESATKYKEVNKDVIAAEKAQEKLTDAMAQLGAVGEPILTAIKNGVANMVSSAVPKLSSLINKVKDGITWFKKNQTTVKAWAGVILGATTTIAAFVLVMKWSSIMTAAANALKKVRTAMLLLNAAMRANPIGFVISLLAGLVVAFLYLWNNVKPFREFWINLWNKIKSATASAVSSMKDKFSALKSVLKTVRDTFGSIQKTISDKLTSAQNKVKSVVDKIKGFFPLKMGKIFSGLKIPKISVSGGKAPFGIAGKGSLPKFNVKWNAQGAVLTKPTIFGMTDNTFLGGGEAGKEAVAPISTLQAYIDESVNQRNNDLIEAFEMQISRLIFFMQGHFPTEYNLMLDTGILAGQLAPEMDSRLADIYRNKNRGNTR